MRIAYVASHIPRRRELAVGPIDAEWIVDESGPVDVVVFADYESEGTDLLRQAEIPLYISPKRTVPMPDGADETAEQLQARILLDHHLAEAFDAIVYDSSQTTDWAWHQPRLGSIPRGVALGAGPVRDIRIVTTAPDLFATHGRKLWALSGSLVTADFLLSDVPASVYGLEGDSLPPRYSLAALPTTPPPARPSALLALVALSEDPAGLATLVERALQRALTDHDPVIAIILPDIATGVETTRDILFESLPEDLQQRVRIAEPSSDGIAEGLLAQADVVVASRSSDLAVPAVAGAAAKVGSMVLTETASNAPRFTEVEPVKRTNRQPVLVPIDRPLEELVPMIDEIADTASGVVLHTPDASQLAQRVWRLPGASRAGLVLVCDAGPYLGDADPVRPAFNLLGFGMESWPSIRRLMLHAGTLHELVEAAGSVSHAAAADLLTVPVLGASHGPLPPRPPGLPVWITEAGVLPSPNLAGLVPVAAGAATYQPVSGEAGIKRWAETHGFRDRIRLALPWKWGLLSRAMRDRW